MSPIEKRALETKCVLEGYKAAQLREAANAGPSRTWYVQYISSLHAVVALIIVVTCTGSKGRHTSEVDDERITCSVVGQVLVK